MACRACTWTVNTTSDIAGLLERVLDRGVKQEKENQRCLRSGDRILAARLRCVDDTTPAEEVMGACASAASGEHCSTESFRAPASTKRQWSTARSIAFGASRALLRANGH